MTIKNIFAPLTRSTASSSSLDTALLLAKTFRAHAEILFIKESAQNALRAAALAEEARFAAQEFAESLEREQEKSEKLTRQRFDDLLEQQRIDHRENSLPADLPSAYWRSIEGAPAEEIEQRGAAYDLIVVARSEDKVASRPIVEAALFGTGCPVLVAPPLAPKVVGERVMIGWNQGVPAARAVRYAMPFLEIAAQVEIFSVDTGAKKGTSAQDIARYLGWHDIKTELNSTPPDQRSVGEVLLSEAKSSGADLLVLGAFSHSRLRQLVLGGVTSYILEHAELPVLMAH
jgi:nucleotide-binding universal stress UspA family protein